MKVVLKVKLSSQQSTKILIDESLYNNNTEVLTLITSDYHLNIKCL